MIRKSLLDLNVLIALAEPGHQHHEKARAWFLSSPVGGWGICPFTEAGFLRVTTDPAYRPGPHTMEEAAALIQTLKRYPGYRYWGINDSWVTLTAPFATRIVGHQQITDAYLLGLAIKENGVLVTLDSGLKYLAGAEFSNNLLVLS